MRRGSTRPSAHELDGLLPRLRRTAVAAHRVPAPRCAARASTAAQARGPEPHRLAQDQQRARSGAAGPAHGQAPARRRDRRRPTRRGDGHRRRAARPRVRVYMGEVDIERQALNVFRMRLLGAEVDPVHAGQPHAEGRHQRGHAGLGAHRRVHALLLWRSVDGPASVPVDGARAPPRDRRRGPRAVPRLLDGGEPDVVVACVGGGSNAAGSFAGSSTRRRARRRRAGGRRRHRPWWCPASCTARRSLSCCRTSGGQVLEADSVSAGLDYPGVGPEHAHLARPRPGPLRGGHRRRGRSTRSRCCRARRGHHPRARAGPRGRLGGPREPHRRLPHGEVGAAEPVRARRQGRGPDDGHLGERRWS